MTVEEARERIPGMVVPAGFRQSRGNIGISSHALCSTFLEDRDLVLSSGKDRYVVSRRLISAFSERVAAVSTDQREIDLQSSQVDRLVRLFQGETVVVPRVFDVSAAIAELRLGGFGAALGLKGAGGFRLSLEPEFVRRSLGEATLRVNGKEVEVSRAGLLLLRQSELTLEETPALDELISLLRLERVVPRDATELREIVKRVGLEWAIDFGCASAAAVSAADLADLNDFDSAVVTPVGDPELAKLLELEGR
jgi:hypothetical protein